MHYAPMKIGFLHITRGPAITKTLAVLAFVYLPHGFALEPRPLWRGNISASISRATEQNKNAGAVGIEPQIFFQPSRFYFIEGLATVQRPFDPQESLKVPRIFLSFHGQVFQNETLSFGGFYSPIASEVDRWSKDGVMLRHLFAGEINLIPIEHFSLLFRAGPFFHTNQYATRANGTRLTSWGFYQRLDATLQVSHWIFQLRLLTEQRKASEWKNDYATQEQIAYELSDHWTLGLVHRFSGQIIDEATGLSQNIQIYDTRESRIALVAEWIF